MGEVDSGYAPEGFFDGLGLSRLLYRLSAQENGSQRRNSFSSRAVKERQSRLTEQTMMWVKRCVDCLEPSRDGLLQIEASSCIAALAGIGLAHRSALLAAGAVPALSNCLTAACSTPGPEHTLVGSLARALGELLSGAEADAARTRADVRGGGRSKLLAALGGYLAAATALVEETGFVGGNGGGGGSGVSTPVRVGSQASSPPGSPSAAVGSSYGGPGPRGPGSSLLAAALAAGAAHSPSGSLSAAAPMARWGSDASLLAGEAAAGGMAAAAAAADPAAGGVSAVLLLLLALARDEAGRGELAASPCAGGPGVGLAGRCVALVEAGGGARGRVPQPDVCAAAALLLAELGPTSSGKEELATPRAMRVLAGAIEGAVEGFSEAAAVRCLAAAAAGGSAATREALRECGCLPVVLRLLQGGPRKEATAWAAQVLAYASATQGNKEALLAAGAVPLLLRCLQGAGAGGGAGVATSPPPFSALSGGPAKYAAHALCNLCLMEEAGRQVLGMQGGMQVLLSLLGSAPTAQQQPDPALPLTPGPLATAPAAAAATAPLQALQVLVNLAAHPALRPSLAAAGLPAALLPFLQRGPSRSQAFELALLALARAVSHPGTRPVAAGGAALLHAVTAALLELVAAPLPAGQQSGLGLGMVAGGGGVGGGAAGGGSLLLSPALLSEALEALADLTREAAACGALLQLQGHLAVLQRLLAAMSSLSGQLPLLAASAAAGSSPPPDSLRQLQAAARCLAHVAVAAPAHPDLRLARTHEALAHVLLCCGLGLGQDAQSGAGVAGRIAVPGVWALQGLCALAVDRACAADLAALGVLPHLTAALEALAEATLSAAAAAADGHSGGGAPERQPSGALPTVRPSGDLAAGGGHKAAAVRTGGGGGGGSQPLAGDVAHVVALALQNMSSHKPLAAAAVQAGAVHAICKWLGVCLGAGDVEGCVLCCGVLTLLGDAAPALALPEMVRADGVELLLQLMHPRWGYAALVPSTAAAAIAVACRWPASAQAVRMAGGIAALAELLLGPHSTGCCRPVVAAIADLIVNDPPSLREIRTTNTVLALGAQLQLLPSNDPRSANIRSLLRQLGEDPATAMRLGLGAKSIQASQQGAGPGAGLSTAGSPDVPGSPFFSANTSASGEAAGPGAGGGGVAQPWASRHSSRRAMGGCGPAGQGSGVWKQPSGDLSWRSGGSCSCSGEDGEGRGGLAGAWRSSGGVGVGAGAGSPPAGAGGALEAMLGESSYRELRRASLRQLARRMDAGDFSDAEEDLEDFMAVLGEGALGRGQGQGAHGGPGPGGRGRSPPRSGARAGGVLHSGPGPGLQHAGSGGLDGYVGPYATPPHNARVRKHQQQQQSTARAPALYQSQAAARGGQPARPAPTPAAQQADSGADRKSRSPLSTTELTAEPDWAHAAGQGGTWGLDTSLQPQSQQQQQQPQPSPPPQQPQQQPVSAGRGQPLSSSEWGPAEGAVPGHAPSGQPPAGQLPGDALSPQYAAAQSGSPAQPHSSGSGSGRGGAGGGGGGGLRAALGAVNPLRLLGRGRRGRAAQPATVAVEHHGQEWQLQQSHEYCNFAGLGNTAHNPQHNGDVRHPPQPQPQLQVDEDELVFWEPGAGGSGGGGLGAQ